MPAEKYKLSPMRLLHAGLAALVVFSYFIPWVNWDGVLVKGMDMATGNFFRISDEKFGLANPFPEISFLFYVFWLIPVLGAACAILPFLNKKSVPLSYITGTLSLSLVTVYVLFSNILIDLGAGQNVMEMLKPFAWVHAIAAVLLILTSYEVKTPLWKAAWIIAGPVIAFTSFKMGEKYVMNQVHEKTQTVNTDYKISADSLISEFLANDTAANKKYVEKVLEVNGKISAVEIKTDSSGTLKFEDSTGSYAIFSFDKENSEQLRKVHPGMNVLVKAICSGSIYSDILGITSISFKRSAIINSNK